MNWGIRKLRCLDMLYSVVTQMNMNSFALAVQSEMTIPLSFMNLSFSFVYLGLSIEYVVFKILASIRGKLTFCRFPNVLPSQTNANLC